MLKGMNTIQLSSAAVTEYLRRCLEEDFGKHGEVLGLKCYSGDYEQSGWSIRIEFGEPSEVKEEQGK